MKKRYFIVEGFKKISDLKKDVIQQDNLLSDEKMEIFRGKSILAKMDSEDEERIKNKILDVLLNEPRNHILSRYTNKMEVEDINYQLCETTIYCKVTISVGRDAVSFNYDAILLITYPSKLKDLEKYLSEEFSYYKTKIILNFVPSENNKESLFFCPPHSAFDKRVVKLDKEDDSDLSNMCYFLNSIEGIDFSYWTLLIDKTYADTSNFECKTSVPLARKFQKIKINNFDINEINVNGILSEKEVKQTFINEINNNNYAGPRNITGILNVNLPVPSNNDRSKGYENYCLNLINKCQDLAKRLNNFSKVYINVHLPEEIQYAYVNYKYQPVFDILQKLLENDYKGAKELGFSINKPQNIILNFRFRHDKLAIFPEVYR